MDIIIYTDGASRGNPGNGGYGVVMMATIGGRKHYKELSEGFRLTTNNRMELLAVIVGLETLKNEGENVRIYSDSKYVVDSVEKGWVFEWNKKGFKSKKNPDLWKRFLNIYHKHNVEFIWVKGHSDNQFNTKCDELAVAASLQDDEYLKDDKGYINSI